MKIKLNHILALFFLIFTTHSYSNVINTINFIGLNNATENSLLDKIPLKIGDEYSDSSSDSIIKSLFKTGLFSDISIINNEDILDITLVENPTVKYFEFNLDKDLSFSSWLKNEKMLITTEILETELESNNLTAGNPFTQNQLDKLVSELKSKYSESGYFNAVIDQNISLDSQNRVGIELNIQKGKRAKIDIFTISGAEKVSEDTLLKLFKIGEPDMAIVNYFTNKDFFNESEFDKGIESMTYFYFNEGYLDFQILDIVTQLDDNKEKISLP